VGLADGVSRDHRDLSMTSALARPPTLLSCLRKQASSNHRQRRSWCCASDVLLDRRALGDYWIIRLRG
jgi:hypothetical protein